MAFIISVEPGTRAFKAGLKDYDIITGINDTEIDNMLDFYSIINDKNSTYYIDVVRNNRKIDIVLER